MINQTSLKNISISPSSQIPKELQKVLLKKGFGPEGAKKNGLLPHNLLSDVIVCKQWSNRVSNNSLYSILIHCVPQTLSSFTSQICSLLWQLNPFSTFYILMHCFFLSVGGSGLFAYYYIDCHYYYIFYECYSKSTLYLASTFLLKISTVYI